MAGVWDRGGEETVDEHRNPMKKTCSISSIMLILMHNVLVPLVCCEILMNTSPFTSSFSLLIGLDRVQERDSKHLSVLTISENTDDYCLYNKVHLNT